MFLVELSILVFNVTHDPLIVVMRPVGSLFYGYVRLLFLDSFPYPFLYPRSNAHTKI